MLKEEIHLLAGQADLFTVSFMSTITDPDELSVFKEFIAQFYSGAAQPILVTKSELIDLQSKIHNREILVNYVFSLRFFALSVLERGEIKKIVDSFATANANKTVTDQNRANNVLPTDSEQWNIANNELAELYDANIWILPLLSLVYTFPNYIEREDNQ